MSTVDSSHSFGSAADFRETLRRAIANGEYEPGEKLIERHLTMRYGVGRTGVRDALRHLAAEGIVVLTENRGARVSELSFADALNMYQVRGVLEGLAGELFAVRGTAQEKIEFAATLPPIRDAISRADATGALTASDIYYAHLLRGARNTELQGIIERLHSRITQIRRFSLSTEEGSGPMVTSLQRIVNAVIAGDAVGAREACMEHVKSSAAATLPAIAAKDEELTARRIKQQS